MATYTLTGPSSGVQGVASSNFTATADATAITGSVVITPSDGGQGGTFAPTTVSFTAAAQAKTFTYTPKTTGAKTISTTSTQSYVNPASLTYTVTMNKDTVINQILLASFENTGKRFPIDELVRDGGISNADAITLRTSFDTYYKSTLDRPVVPVALPDEAADIASVNTFRGRSGRGGGNVRADKAADIDTTTSQTGRSKRGGAFASTGVNKTTTSTGRR